MSINDDLKALWDTPMVDHTEGFEEYMKQFHVPWYRDKLFWQA